MLKGVFKNFCDFFQEILNDNFVDYQPHFQNFQIFLKGFKRKVIEKVQVCKNGDEERRHG